MAKKKEVQTQDGFEAELKGEPKVFDAVTIGISKTATGFNIIKVTVDSKGLEAGEVEVLDTAESKVEANEKFKINVVRQGIL